MPDLETTEITLSERAILASAASAAYLDHFSRADRHLISEYQQPSRVDRERRYYSRGQEWIIKWQDYGQPLPNWFDPLMQGFVDLLTLPPNWDSYVAGPIDFTLVQEAMAQMNTLLIPSSPAPRVVPLSTGGLQIEWHRNDIDLEIAFERGENPSFYYRDRTTGEEAECTLPDDTNRLRSVIGRLE